MERVYILLADIFISIALFCESISFYFHSKTKQPQPFSWDITQEELNRHIMSVMPPINQKHLH